MAAATNKQQAHSSGTYHLGPCRGILLCSSVRTISRCKERKTGCLLYSMEIRRKRCPAADEYVSNYFTSFGLLTHLDKTKWWNNRLWNCSSLTTFAQQVCSMKIGYANALSLGSSSCKKGTWPVWTVHIKQKSRATLIVVGTTTGWFT